MDLQKLMTLDVDDLILPAEGLTITVRKRERSRRLRGWTALIAGFGGMTITMFPLMALMFWAAGINAVLAVFCGLLMFTTCIVVGGYGFMRYLDPSSRRYLPTVMEPQARAFFLANAERRERLFLEGIRLDMAIEAFKALPARAGEDEIGAGVLANLAERRAKLAAEVEAYLEEFKAATADDRARVAAIEAARNAPKIPESPDKRALLAFKERVATLRRLEAAVEGLSGSVEAGVTVDVSPYVAAHRLRSELEEERAALVARGLKPKALPTPRVARKFLPA